jgi:hypothetical protein
MKKSHSEPWEKAPLRPVFEEGLNAKLRNRIAYSPCRKRWILIEEGGSYSDQGCRIIRSV